MKTSAQAAQAALTRMVIKTLWGSLLTVMALPTAFQWTDRCTGILTPVVTVALLGTVAISPFVIACGSACDDIKEFVAYWRKI